jgi:hypothetical protein
MRLRKDKTGDATGQPSWRLSFLGDADAKLFCGSEQTRRDESEILPHPGSALRPKRVALRAPQGFAPTWVREVIDQGGGAK